MRPGNAQPAGQFSDHAAADFQTNLELSSRNAAVVTDDDSQRLLAADEQMGTRGGLWSRLRQVKLVPGPPHVKNIIVCEMCER